MTKLPAHACAAPGNFADEVQDMGVAGQLHNLSHCSSGATDSREGMISRAFSMQPRKGQYVVLQPSLTLPKSALLWHPLQPLPTDTTKGVMDWKCPLCSTARGACRQTF